MSVKIFYISIKGIFVSWSMLDAFTVEDGCLYISLGFNLDLAVIHILYMLIYFKKCHVFNQISTDG